MSGRDLASEPWLTSPETRRVLAALEAAGGPGAARFVGGCVRNALLGAPVDDLDLATPLKPEAVMAALRAAGLKVVPTGVDHGTVTAVSGGRPYEVTTLRRDVETDGRRAVVAFTEDWAEDAARRDFRLNALYADGDGRVFDPTGWGLADLEARRIVFVGEARTRIREDYLRILRFFRFHAWYGSGEPDADGLAASVELKDGVARLSVERIYKELMKLLAAPDPRPAVRVMAASGVLAVVLPEARDDLSAFDRMAGAVADPVLRLSALLPERPEVAEAAARRLRAPNAVSDRLSVAASGGVDAAIEARGMRIRVWRDGLIAATDQARRAGAEGRIDAAMVEHLVSVAERWKRPRLPVGGRDAAAAGATAGPEVGQALKRFEDSWVADDFPMDGHAARLAEAVEAVRAGRG
ncbi:CCA tRNA nucleotidyltransferase [Brevundimonas sp. VNH65]|uniref:CCA tRNA nucleotidyltransferase n=1 Tax=Brevundimonas sp. VNH65 TaxID=3400917 RepID=UPI003C102F52